MRIIQPLSLLSALMLFVGCNDNVNENIEQAMAEKWYFTLDTSRTILGDADADGRRPLYWSNGDCIAINGLTSEPLADIGDTAQAATFAFSEEPSLPYNILYPASIYTDATSVTLPMKREISPEVFDVPMAAFVEEDGAVHIRHICAAIKLPLVRSTKTVYSDKYPVRYIKFEGNAKEQVSGLFEIDYATRTLTSLIDPPQDGYYHESRWSRTYINHTLTDETTTVYLVVPAVEYAAGFTITIYNTQGHGMECKKSSAVTLSPGEIYTLPQVAYHPTFTEIEVGI